MSNENLIVHLRQKIVDLTQRNKTLSSELNRIRTTETASAHALDVLRQKMGLGLVIGEHPADTRSRIEKKMEKTDG